MTTIPPIPPEAAAALANMLDGCAGVQPGQHVLILAAPEGLYGGRNMVDATTVAWVQAGVQQRGAHPTVIWADMPVRRPVIWPDIATAETVWRIPPVVKQAMKGADLLISHVADLSSEEHLKELPRTLREYELPMVRNMATTAPLMCSVWARTPHELINELRYRTAELVVPGERWELTHPNGTHLTGTVGPGPREGGGYAYWRKDGYYWPFPEGVYPAVDPRDTEGVLVFDRMMPVWARKIGVPPAFGRSVEVTVENNHIVQLSGGAEADTIRGFLAELAKVLGEDEAYEIRAPHGGVHPAALVSAAQCPNDDYREFIASFHTGSVHMHLGQGGRNKDFPYSLHTACEVRGATLRVGNHVLHENGRLGVLDDPRVQEVAARHADSGLPGLDGERWIYG